MTKQFLLLGAVTLLGGALAFADVTVFRGIDKKNATYAKVNDGQWRVDPDGVSTFEDPPFSAPTKACKASFVVLGVNSRPAQGTRGQIQNMPTGYEAEYTPQHGGVGHWSIQGPNGTPNAVLQTAITQYVIAQGAASVNASYTGKNPSACTTPGAPNLRRLTTFRNPR
jgi:hypothetical protein